MPSSKQPSHDGGARQALEMRRAAPHLASSGRLKHLKTLSKNNLTRKRGREGQRKGKERQEETERALVGWKDLWQVPQYNKLKVIS